MFKKRTELAVLGILFVSTMSWGCHTEGNYDSTAEETDSIAGIQPVDSIEVEELYTDVVKRLFEGIPGNGEERDCVTPEFYKLIRLAYEIPTLPGTIGDETMYFWLAGEGDVYLVSNKVKETESPDKAKVTIGTVIGDNGEIWSDVIKHEMDLERILVKDANGSYKKLWRISDFDGRKSEVIESLNSNYKDYKKDNGRDLWELECASYGHSIEEKNEFLQTVSEWLKMFEAEFPDGVAK